MVQRVTWYEVATNDCRRRINQFHKKLDTILGQGKHYAVDLDGLDNFVNGDVTNSF